MNDLYMDAAVIVDNDLYFMTCNDNGLYKLDLFSNEIEQVKVLPMHSNNIRKFSSLIYYKEKIWMIPRGEIYIYIYDIKNGELSRLSMPNFYEYKLGIPMFRRAVVINNNIWLTPDYYNSLIKIDMDLVSYEIVGSDSADVVFSEDRINLQNISYYNNKIYGFRNMCSSNFEYDIENKKINKLELKTDKEFGAVIDNNIYVSPRNYEDNIRIYSFDDVAKYRTIIIEDEARRIPEYYMYWYIEKIHDNIYFLPHEASKMIVFNPESESIKYVETYNADYKCLDSKKRGAISEIFEWNDYCIAISYMGNEVFYIDKKGNLKKHIVIGIDESKKGTAFEGFIEGVVSCNRSDWKQIGTKETKEYIMYEWKN